MPSDGDEDDLLRAARDGDRAAAERLVEATYGRVYGALHRLCGGDRELAADLTQETYRRAWEGLAGFAGRARFSTWLYRIAYTTFLNHLRRPRRLVPFTESAAEVPDPAPAEDDLIAGEESGARLRRAVEALPETLRFAVTAHYWADLPVRELARLEGLTEVGVRKRLRRALTLLDAALREA